MIPTQAVVVSSGRVATALNADELSASDRSLYA